jgi:hypothetical protein
MYQVQVPPPTGGLGLSWSQRRMCGFLQIALGVLILVGQCLESAGGFKLMGELAHDTYFVGLWGGAFVSFFQTYFYFVQNIDFHQRELRHVK